MEPILGERRAIFGKKKWWDKNEKKVAGLRQKGGQTKALSHGQATGRERRKSTPERRGFWKIASLLGGWGGGRVVALEGGKENVT